MSTTTTLAALQALFQTQLPSATVLDRPQAIPYSGAFPALILTPYRDYVERVYTGERGNDPNRPNIYSFVYLNRTAQEQGTSLSAAASAVYADIETIKAIFSTKANEVLPDEMGNAQVEWAGGQITVEYDRSGPFLTYGNTIYIGVYGTITVLELYRTDS